MPKSNLRLFQVINMLIYDDHGGHRKKLILDVVDFYDVSPSSNLIKSNLEV